MPGARVHINVHECGCAPLHKQERWVLTWGLLHLKIFSMESHRPLKKCRLNLCNIFVFVSKGNLFVHERPTKLFYFEEWRNWTKHFCLFLVKVLNSQFKRHMAWLFWGSFCIGKLVPWVWLIFWCHWETCQEWRTAISSSWARVRAIYCSRIKQWSMLFSKLIGETRAPGGNPHMGWTCKFWTVHILRFLLAVRQEHNFE